MPATLTGWIAYASDRGRTVVNEPASQQALVRAQDYIRMRLAGITDPGDTATTEATYIAAAFEFDEPGFWSKIYTPTEAKVLTKAGPIEWDPVDTGARGVEAMMPVSPMIEALLSPTLAYVPGVFVV